MEEQSPHPDIEGSVPPEDSSVEQPTRSPTARDEAASDMNVVDTPQKFSDFRDESMSRASSLDRSSPVPFSSRQQSITSAPAPAPAAHKKRSTTGPPKGIAIRKPASKKRKLDANGENPNGSDYINLSPSANAFTGKESSSEPKKPRKKPTKSRTTERNGPDLFCICRTADDHTWMIACDGGCEDWFHGKCVNIDEGDSELIDKYICPSCQEREGKHTTFKPMCRYPTCRKPARATDTKPSKYCSNEHGTKFMQLQLAKRHAQSSRSDRKKRTERPTLPNKQEVDQDDTPTRDSYDADATEDELSPEADAASREGVLSASELRALIDIVKSALEFRNLGNETDDNAFINMEIDKTRLTFKEQERILQLREQLHSLKKDADRLRDRERLLRAIRHHGKAVVDYLKANEPSKTTKFICLFDSRLCWSDVEFDDWRFSEIGRTALDTCQLPETATILQDRIEKSDVDADTNGPLNNLINASVMKGICPRRRKCETHHSWSSIQEEDIYHEIRITSDAIKKAETEIIDVMRSVYFRITGEPTSCNAK
ncbi:hypothetical protein KEM56_004919 [Ascosphaera pollenicola]|nr:hypothetical protein KEM56_004919 [Ascosphaera pollenicola]